jgi:glycosyltransferase involved in cell wall biosynthesis
MKNKVLTALAMSLPVVATSAALANIEVRPGVDVLAADEPAQFARHVVALLGDPGAAARLAVCGRRLVVERYSWRQRGEELEALVAGTPQPTPVHA